MVGSVAACEGRKKGRKEGRKEGGALEYDCVELLLLLHVVLAALLLLQADKITSVVVCTVICADSF